MTQDPYRTLGLEHGASAAEVKRAYRRLAKAFHPDSAGEAALPRFLAIHEAYEAIRTGRPMGGTRAGARPSSSAATPPAEPWRADPARARAARERARSSRSGKTGGASTRSGSGGGTRATGATGSAGSGGSSGTSGPRGRRGGTRKATLGSTSYDEARDPADASWSGASWYGPTTGEYWIINPREYADPRKHGPEYQSRARRMAADPSVSGTLEDEPPFVATPADEAAVDHGAEWTAAGATWAGEDARRQAFETRAAAADPVRRQARAERAARAAHARPRSTQGAPARPAPTRPAPARPEPALGDVGPTPGWQAPAGIPGRDWFGGTTDDAVRRLGAALVAWPPIGLAAAIAIGESTGCTSFAASCDGSDPLLPWLAQAGVLGLLLLLPGLARLLVGGTVAILLALVPVTAFLLVVGGGGQPEAGFALGFLLGIAWVVGVAGSVLATRRGAVPDRAGGAP